MITTTTATTIEDPVIFLDIDGVLNNKPYCDANRYAPDLKNQISEENLMYLHLLVRSTHAKIILCSTWKDLWHSKDQFCIRIRREFIKRLLNHGLSIAGFTPNHHLGRAYEVALYLKAHPEIRHYVILNDDETDKHYKRYGLFSHLVRTQFCCEKSSEGGLQYKHVEKATAILKGDIA